MTRLVGWCPGRCSGGRGGRVGDDGRGARDGRHSVALRVRRIPFIVSSGHEDIAALGGPLFKGISNVGKPAAAEVLIAALESVMGLLD